MVQQTQVKTYENYINGEWISSSDMETFQSINPADTSDVLGQFASSTSDDVKKAMDSASEAFPNWAATPPGKRAEILNKAAALLERRVDEIGKELTREEGKILSAGKGEVKRTAQTLRYYAVEGLGVTGETHPNDDTSMDVTTQKEPLGVVSIITPWNFPISIPARKMAPALMMGNTVVFKPSSDTPLIGYRLVEALHEAGIPSGVLNFVTGRSSKIGDSLTTHPSIRAISFTGSTDAGEDIHSKVSLTTRTQMELGGKNPLIVLDDADIEHAAQLAITGGFNLTGQACTGTSRVIVMQSVADEFIDTLKAKTQELTIDNGLKENVNIGPLANQSQMDIVLNYIDIGEQEGAQLVYGGKRITGSEFDEGYFIQPTLFTNVSPSMRIAQEEIFGPVIAIISVEDYDEAIKVANGVDYGLAASIATRDISKAHQFTKDIEAGTVKVNRPTTGNLINAPFGGLKKSSTSTFRESGRAGLEFFTQIKTVYVGY